MAKKVVVGLSGGVDSSVAAALLLEQGYEVSGVYLECWNSPGCRTDQDKKDALRVALQLGIPFEVLDFRKEYKEKVVEYFYNEYEAGRTPNPDVLCNREIKFGMFYDWAMKMGFDYVATGHYARIASYKAWPCKVLQRPRDLSKDQSYFLYQVPREHLEHILFPLGKMMKKEVREKARELKLSVADKPDSMGICFMGDVDVRKLLRDKLGEKPGDVVLSSELCNIGTHQGLWFYTIGQRSGFEVNKKQLRKLGYQPEKMGPLYVIGKDIEKNILLVGKRKEACRQEFIVNNLPSIRGEVFVRIRNLGELQKVTRLQSDTVTRQTKIKVDKPIFGVAEGQSAVFYDSMGIVLGGGDIAF